MQAVGYLSTFIVMMIVGTLLSGFTINVMWGWFVVPTFDLPQISIAEAIGLGLLVNYFTHTEESKDKEKSGSDILGQYALKIIMKPALYLFVGWIVSKFI